MRRAAVCLVLLGACSSRDPVASPRLANRLPEPYRSQVDQAPVAVLLPRTLNLDNARLVTKTTYSALSVPGDGYHVALHSARVAHDFPLPAGAAGAAKPMRGTTGYTTANEGIRTASWIEGDVAHALDLECADPTDARCADDTLLLSLVESLELAGGGITR